MNSEIAPGSQASVRIERPASGGGVGRMPDGRVVFVRHSLPGEMVRVEINETTANFYRGDAIEILEASPHRVVAPCEYAHAGGCGGCDLQHADPDAQVHWKSTLVAEHLRRIAGIEREVVISITEASPRGSRTRLRCAVDDEGRLSLRSFRSHDLVAIDSCWIADETFAPAFSASWDGAEEVELRAIGDGAPFAIVRRETHRGTIYEICSLRGEPLEPSTQSRVAVQGHVFSVSPRSFWQSHREAPEVLLASVLEFADVKAGDHVVDLFSGVGLFSVPLAKIVGPGGRVTAVESSPYAVRDARQNGDGLRQMKVREWSVTPRSINDSVSPGDVVVLDPPRAGLAKGVAQALVRRAPRRIVYVSCDAATFARDLKVLVSGGFELKEFRVFDLFPMTEHVELVALLDNAL
ncbi:MAG TPA: TRAM domain-containing protein [Acidimicrobiales bacterium]|nr:TRAM domain-containing protein [Acidimicrobiales bacterium]HUX03681.1 TRAM domain-containing protein [Acidimicrobiales bacterium]